MRSSEAVIGVGPRRILPTAVAFGLAGAVALFELAVFFLMMHPQVSADYRAYYLDRTTTCLPEPVTGSYVLGTAISFRGDGAKQAAAIRSCGWFSPYGEGTPSKGEASRLRFDVPADTGPLELTLTFAPLVKDNIRSQRVVVSANDVELKTLTADEGLGRAYVIPIPAEVVAQGKKALEIKLDYPDAISFTPGGRGSNTQKRSIMMKAVRLAPPASIIIAPPPPAIGALEGP